MYFTLKQSELILDRPEDCIAEHLNEEYGEDLVQERISFIYANLGSPQKELPDTLQPVDIAILENCLTCNTIMARINDCVEFNDGCTRKEQGAYKNAMHGLVKKLNKMGCDIEDNWELYY